MICLSFSWFQYDKPTVDYFQGTSFCVPKRGSSNFFCGLFSVMQQSNSILGLLIVEVSRAHTDTPHSGRLLWTSDQPVAESVTYATHNEHKRRTSMPSAGFEPTIPAIALQTYALAWIPTNGAELSPVESSAVQSTLTDWSVIKSAGI